MFGCGLPSQKGSLQPNIWCWFLLFQLLTANMEFDWHRIFFSDHQSKFFLEILFRTPIMFLAVLAVLRLTGKRGGQQFSIFEIVMIITLGSAAGDAMFYEEVGLLHALAVFVVIIIIYKLVVWIITKSEKAEIILEGGPVYIIREGRLCHEEISGDEMGADEFFAELRFQNVQHLGQVKIAIMEANGKISVFYYPEAQVRYGLPILPDVYEERLTCIPRTGIYSCVRCGHTEELQPAENTGCPVCENQQWVMSINELRIT